MASNTERTFIAVKPDGVQRGLVGEIIKRFEQKGFRLVAMKFMHASENLLKQHYIDLKDRPFYPGLVKYMNSGPVVAMVWEARHLFSWRFGLRDYRLRVKLIPVTYSLTFTIRRSFTPRYKRVMLMGIKEYSYR
uniref:nucleoside-diphosphate kinase n=1 Tax=Chelydra serpentina TaxID=8475 RepID=A0A8C3XMB1_CHESE